MPTNSLHTQIDYGSTQKHRKLHLNRKFENRFSEHNRSQQRVKNRLVDNAVNDQGQKVADSERSGNSVHHSLKTTSHAHNHLNSQNYSLWRRDKSQRYKFSTLNKSEWNRNINGYTDQSAATIFDLRRERIKRKKNISKLTHSFEQLRHKR